eukprot:SM000214S06790  [mRNA]  locus=s214:131854:134544:- [translate_table: standard]
MSMPAAGLRAGVWGLGLWGPGLKGDSGARATSPSPPHQSGAMAGLGDGYVGSAQDAVRIRRLEKQREQERQRIEALKKKSAEGGGQGLLQFGQGTSEVLESAFKKETVGLVTREQFVEKRATIKTKLEEKQQQLAQEEELRAVLKRKQRRARAGATLLSFADDMDDEKEAQDGASPSHASNGLSGWATGAELDDGSQPRKLSKFGKDPTVETSFLPDREREAQEQAERARLRKEWMAQQERIKNEPLEITYSYWDGAGHRRVLQVRKGDTIAEFLRAVQQQLSAEFREVRTSSVENMLYIKEDLIIPHQYTFYELIINKARGKSGPLFHFDVHEDIRTTADATIEKDESHAGKVVERHWYEKNKHIFPASRWEIYDPTKRWERYTIHGA